MPFNAQGVWVPENDDVAPRLNSLTASTSPYIQQARAAGMASANKRGLLNSSMAAGAAEGAAIGAALPIASQEAQQIAQKNSQTMQGGFAMDQQKSQEAYGRDIQKAEADATMARQTQVTASNDRTAAANAVAEAQKSYLEAFGNIAANKDIPAATRDAYLGNLTNIRNSGIDFVQQLYGVDLQWAGKPTAPVAGTPAPTAPSTISPGYPSYGRNGVQTKIGIM